MIEETFKNILLANSGVHLIVGERVVPLIRSTKDDVPAITYAADEPSQKRNLDGSFEKMIRQRFEIECWHHSYDDAKLLSGMVIKTLQTVFNQQHGRYYFHMITVGGDSEDKLDDANVVNLTATLIYEDDEETTYV